MEIWSEKAMTPRDRVIKTMEVNNNLVDAMDKTFSRISRELRRNRNAVSDNHFVTKQWLSKGITDRKTRKQSRVLDGSLDVSILQAILNDEYKTLNRCLLALGKVEEITARCANQNSRD
jgi:hypothetical protein